jgi:molybdopterin synthase sulfur carrier subunit
VPRVCFTSHLERHVRCPVESVPGATARQVLEAYFALHGEVRSYVLDEQGQLRRHVVLFVDGEQVSDRQDLSDSVSADSELYVMQALSGG